MFQKVLKTARGKWAVALIILAILGVISSISKNEFDNQAIIGTIELLIVSAILYYSAQKTINTPASVYWEKWSQVPLNDAQMRRLERGIECGFTPKKLNLDAKYAVIVGSSEYKAYKTTLTKCTCPDFQKRKLPCKHIYYLALQTGAIDKYGNAIK